MSNLITEKEETILSYEYEGRIINLVRLPTGRDVKIAFLQQERKKNGFSEGIFSRCVTIDGEKASPQEIEEWEADFAEEFGNEILQTLLQLDNPKNGSTFPNSFKFISSKQVEAIKDLIFTRYPDRDPNELKLFFQSGGAETDREFEIELFNNIESPLIEQVESRKLKHDRKAQSLATGKIGSNSWGFEYSLRLASQLLQIDGNLLTFDNFLDLDASLCQAIVQYFAPKESDKKKKKFTRLKH